MTNSIKVNTARSYDIIIKDGGFDEAGVLLKNIAKSNRCHIVSDSNVAPLYARQLQKSLSENGIESTLFIFPAGEESKNPNTLTSILNFLIDSDADRSDFLIALGGGVTGDLTGFAASCYMRGMSFIQIPTSLLSMADSSVGGKTAIDMAGKKNIVGAFWQPSLVICDPLLLNTLPDVEYKSGLAECIKAGIIGDEKLFNMFSQENPDIQEIIYRSIAVKKSIVEQDEFDQGERMILNLGHTYAHAIESLGNFTIKHGYAVATGMCIATKKAYEKGICTRAVHDEIIGTIAKNGLPTSCEYSDEAIHNTIRYDKKRIGDKINMIYPETIGHCVIRLEDI